jgi:hypothetical protein
MLPLEESYGWYRFGLGLIRGWFVPRMMFVLAARFDSQGVAKLRVGGLCAINTVVLEATE